MNQRDIEQIESIKDDREMLDIVEKIIRLQQEIECPERKGMIEALRDAQQIACNEIVQNIQQQSGNVYTKAWSDFSDPELYQMLPQYKQGLVNHGIAKIGKSKLEELLAKKMTGR